MKVYRISKAVYAKDLSGNGARLYGGRWNSEGNFALYAAENRALALVETLVHTPIKFLKSNPFLLIEIEIPLSAGILKMDLEGMPQEWDAYIPAPSTRKLGDAFLAEQKHLLLQVPSVLMPEECNYVINPLHGDMKHVKVLEVRLLTFNDRLLQSLK